MSLHYLVIGPTRGSYHVAYRIPGTNNFSSVAVSMSIDAANRLADNLNEGDIDIVSVPTTYRQEEAK